MTAKQPFRMVVLATWNLVVPFSMSIAILAGIPALLLGGAPASWAQAGTLPLGQVTSFTQIVGTCPKGKNGSQPLSQAVCYTATVDSCPSHQAGVTIPAISATVAISTPSNWNKATIFLHNGGDGEDFFDAKDSGQGTSYAATYFNNGYQVIQIAWADNWANNANNPSVKVLKYNACRPATILNYVYNSVKGHGGNTGFGMCAQGHSAGSAAMASTLAWYGAGSYLDDVVLTSGPVYSNIAAGCQYPAAAQFQNPITVCPAGQFGCVGNSWTDAVQYSATNGTAKFVAGETNSPAGNCNNYTGTGTATTSFDQNWRSMSIASSGANFNYPTTSLYAFLCSPNSSQNNSAAEGQLFYTNITSANPPLHYNVYRVDGCTGPEDIWNGATSTGSRAFAVSSNALVTGCHK